MLFTRLVKYTLLALSLLITEGHAQDSSFYQRKPQWSNIIDDFWSAGDPLAEKQDIFNQYADRLETKYPLFEGITFDFDSMRTATYELITEETSRGGFSAIMAHYAYSFRELHTRMWDEVLENTPPLPGTPIFFLNSFDMRHAGFSLTTQEDGSLVIVDVASDLPIDLMPGDILLGYEGVPWSVLTEELWDAKVPLGGWYGSTAESIHYVKMTNASMNWHLFNSMDVVKHSSGDTLNLSLEPMATFYSSDEIYNNPQLPIEGVPMPNYDLYQADNHVTHGIVENTNIGYIYVNSHAYAGVNEEFGDAVEAIMDTDGLIIDLRWNTGGFQQLFEGMSMLFDFNFKPLQILWRCNETDINNLCEENWPYWFNWNENDPNTSYDKPIAVLIGPNAQSFGDIFARTMEFHPEARFFGRPTNGGFAGQITANALVIDGWHVTAADFTMADTTGLLTSRARPPVVPDEDIWLTANDIANGDDSVVERALEWITDQPGVLTNQSIQIDGIQRDYELYTPAAYDGSEPWPLVLNLHGYSSDTEFQLDVSQLNAVADTAHFLVAYPVGLTVTRSLPDHLPDFVPTSGAGWHVPDIPSDHDDIAFLRELIESLEMSHAVDSQRVHVMGLSLGGSMALHAAAQLKDQLASVASVAAFPTDLILSTEQPGSPISQLVIHGTEDGVFSADGKPGHFASPANTMELLRIAGACDNEFTETALPDLDSGDGSTVTLFQATDCIGGHEISYYRVDNGDHTWPGADQSFFNTGLGSINGDIHLVEVIWHFFRRNPNTISSTNLEQSIVGTPRDYLITNYPNPFNPSTSINYDLPVASDVALSVYDIAGRQIIKLTDSHKPAGRYTTR